MDELPPGFELEDDTPAQQPQSAPVRATQSQSAPVAPPPAPAAQTPAYTPAPAAPLTSAPGDVTDTSAQVKSLVERLYKSGASADEIRSQVRALGVDPDAAVLGLDQAVAYRDKQHALSPVGYGLPAPVHGTDRGGLDALGNGALDSTTLGFGDELTGFLGAARNELDKAVGDKYADDRSFWDEYEALRNQQRQALSDADYYHPISTNVGRVGGALIMPTAGVGEGATLAQMAGRMALEGGGYGALYGAGSTDGDVGDRLVGAALGGALGAAAGAALSPLAKAGSSIAANRAVGRSAGQDVLDAANHLNSSVHNGEQVLQPLPGHVSIGNVDARTGAAKGGLVSGLHALAEPSLLEGRMSGLAGKAEGFRNAAGETLSKIADREAGGPSTSLPKAAAMANDETLPGSLASFADEFRQGAGAEYTHAANLAGDVKLQTPRTINEIDKLLNKWRAVPGGVDGIKDLEAIREELANGKFTVDGLRRLRTAYGEKLGVANRTAREESKAIWPALSRDINQGLRDAGKADAAKAYRLADVNYARNSANLKVVKKVIGDGTISSDALASKLAGMSRRDALRLSAAMRTMSPEISGQLRGGLINNLGLKSAGQATAEGEFSLTSFLTNWQKMGEEAKHALFTPDTKADLDALATLARADRRVNKLGNPSRSGVTLFNLEEVGEGLSLAHDLFGAAVSPHHLGLLFGRWGVGVLLSRPGVARALVRGAQSKKLQVVLQGLTRAAKMTPAYASNILGFRDQLASIGVQPVDSGMDDLPADFTTEGGGASDDLPAGFELES